jgi:lipopolysaccharide export system permease protein
MLLTLKHQPVPPIKPIVSPEVIASTPKPASSTSRQHKLGIGKKGQATGGPSSPSKGSISGPFLPVQEINRPLNQYTSLLETFRLRDRSSLMKEAKTQHGLNQNWVESGKKTVEGKRLDWVKTGYELYNKYSFALICFVFLFIGAPMGAIIRKGGFGYPILVSIIFFVTFVFLAILCRKLAEAYIMTPFWAAMMPCAILAIFGIYVTRKAMNDSQLFSTDGLERFLFKIRLAKKQKNALDAA